MSGAPHDPFEWSPHAYPNDLVPLLQKRWAAVQIDGEPALPSAALLERLVSVCYQASLLRDEGRPITFRVTLAPPERFRSTEGPPTELHRLTLTRARPFDEH